MHKDSHLQENRLICGLGAEGDIDRAQNCAVKIGRGKIVNKALTVARVNGNLTDIPKLITGPFVQVVCWSMQARAPSLQITGHELRPAYTPGILRQQQFPAACAELLSRVSYAFGPRNNTCTGAT